jgi:hypothetical protein
MADMRLPRVPRLFRYRHMPLVGGVVAASKFVARRRLFPLEDEAGR